jgi:hypothetical protein
MRFAPVDLQLRAYVDASYGIHDDCKSQYGVLLRVGHSSAAIHARSSNIKVVTRSALESELYAINDIASEILFERDIVNEIGYLPSSNCAPWTGLVSALCLSDAKL